MEHTADNLLNESYWNITDPNIDVTCQDGIQYAYFFGAFIFTVPISLSNGLFLVCMYRNRDAVWMSKANHVIGMIMTDFVTGLLTVFLACGKQIRICKRTVRMCLLEEYIFLLCQGLSLNHILAVCIYKVNRINTMLHKRTRRRVPFYVSNIVIWTLTPIVYGVPYLVWSSNTSRLVPSCDLDEVYLNDTPSKCLNFLTLAVICPWLLTNVLYVTACARFWMSLRQVSLSNVFRGRGCCTNCRRSRSVNIDLDGVEELNIRRGSAFKDNAGPTYRILFQCKPNGTGHTHNESDTMPQNNQGGGYALTDLDPNIQLEIKTSPKKISKIIQTVESHLSVTSGVVSSQTVPGVSSDIPGSVSRPDDDLCPAALTITHNSHTPMETVHSDSKACSNDSVSPKEHSPSSTQTNKETHISGTAVADRNDDLGVAAMKTIKTAMCTIGILVVVYDTCMWPLIVQLIGRQLSPSFNMPDITFVLLFANQVVNPLVYTFRIRPLREALMVMLKDVCKCWR